MSLVDIGVIRLKDGKSKQMRIRDLLPPILLLTVCLTMEGFVSLGWPTESAM